MSQNHHSDQQDSPFKGFNDTSLNTTTIPEAGENQKEASVVSSKKSKSSSIRRRQLELEMEAAVKMSRLKIQQLEEEGKLIKTQLELQQKFLEDAGSESSSCSRISLSSKEKINNVKKWVKDHSDQHSIKKNCDEIQFESTVINGICDKKIIDETNRKSDKSDEEIRDETIKMNDTRDDEFLGEQPKIKHFLARQSMNKELPYFAGDPMDWPLFLSNFVESTISCNFSNSENMCRLQKCLRGPAKEAVQCLLIHPDNVVKVMDTLQFRFGRSEQIICELIEKARDIKPPREDKLETLMLFATSVQNLSEMLKVFKNTPHMMNPQLIQELVGKLPSSLQLRWGEKLLSNLTEFATVEDFSDWLIQIAKASSLVVKSTPFNSISTLMRSKSEQQNFRQESNKKFGVFSHLPAIKEESSSVVVSKCEFCKNTDHKITSCEKFKNLKNEEKWEFVRKAGVCFSCLRANHRLPDCKFRRRCSVSGCKRSHHALLHRVSEVTESKEKEEINCHTVPMNVKEKMFFKILPVKLHGPKGEISTYAFLDDGSSITLLEDHLAESLGLIGDKSRLCLKWTGNTIKNEDESMKSNLEISGINDEHQRKFVMKNVRTVQNLSLPTQTIDIEELQEIYPHLRDLKIDGFKNVAPGILIGIDQVKLGVPLDVSECDDSGLIAVKTKLGWVIYGSNSTDDNNDKDDFSFHISQCECNKEENLHQMIKNYFTTEDFGVKVPEKLIESKEDVRSLEIFDKTTKRVGDRFETGLLWKFDEVVLPKSYEMAERRLKCIERKMDKDEDYSKAYCNKIEEYIEKGYAVKLSNEDVKIDKSCTWYLPHFGVVNPNKPGKFRLVFDAAAKTDGVSLNDVLMKGPDRYNSLLGVLYKFRQGKVAICGDIKEMFHQVKIRDEDICAQRFLWRANDKKKKPDVFAMKAMIFGAACSPSSAQEVKNRNALEFKTAFPEAVDAILHKHYVDDYLDSFSTEEKAYQTLQEVSKIHKHGGFEMTNWLTNSQVIVEKLQTSNVAVKSLNFESDEANERVLGLYWNASNDQYQFQLKFNKVDKDLLDNTRRPTKREVLRILMSIFDPIGFVAQFTVYMKILLQDIWTSGIGWDDTLPDGIYASWKIWMAELSKIKELRIPRCYMLSVIDPVEIQLHTFVDASEAAFGAVSYFRFEDENGKLEVSFVGAKARVAPQKMLSIPRLELQAAVLGSRMAHTIQREHSLKITKQIFWSDSKTVLSWLHSDARKYKPFVGHRITEVLEVTDVSNWRWIPTKLNVADEATKWVTVPEFNSKSRWYSGPEFLLQEEIQWPKEEVSISRNTEEEIKSIFVGVTTNLESEVILPDVKRFSRYDRFLRTTAWILRYKDNCLKKVKGVKLNVGELEVKELKLAEKLIFRKIQSEMFETEIVSLKNGKLNRRSSLIKLSPCLDEDGILRVSGRIDAAPVSENVKKPIILDRHHPVTKLILQKFHVQQFHQGHETVVNEVRQRFWIPKLRSAVKNTKSECQDCKNRSAVPVIPQMGSLPAVRLTPFVRPFTYTGIDYFGPMEVTVGRRHEKRWGVLFTCMTVRAVHIEISHSLSTDSFIMCFRNFVARRGYPEEIFTDNGTNFKGAEKELREAIVELDKDEMMKEFASKGVKWNFIPPAAPHMGGCWERLVQSVKKVIKIVLTERFPKDEALRNFLMEAEKTVNSRPLTYEPIEIEREELLTPNHFLIGSSSGNVIGKFQEHDLILRKQWRATQQLANHFWRRWLKEYLPTLIKREKWFEKVKPVEVGSMVIIVDDKFPRNCWPKGIISQVYPGKDGQVRVVDVRTSSGYFKRPVAKIIVLDVVAAPEVSKS